MARSHARGTLAEEDVQLFDDDFGRSGGTKGTSGRPLTWWYRVAGRSRRPQRTRLRDPVLRGWVEKLRREPARRCRLPTTQAAPMSVDQAAEVARLPEENERLRMERDITKRLIGAFS